eukprot:170082-Rhodomonas_salina.1
MTAEIAVLKDKQLGHCLAHHCFVTKLPADWFPKSVGTQVDCAIMVCHCYGLKGKYYLDCKIVAPVSHQGQTIQFPLSEPPLSKKQIKNSDGGRETYCWWVRKLLDTVFAEPTTLEDISMTMSVVEQVNQTLLNLWSGAPTTVQQPYLQDNTLGGASAQPKTTGPFQDPLQNEIWKVFTSQMMENYEQLANVDMLEPSQTNSNEAMQTVRLCPFWIYSEKKEMD